MTKRGPLLYRSLFLSKNLNAGPIVLHETGHEQSLDPDSTAPPPFSFGHILCVQASLSTNRGSSLWMYCYRFHSGGGMGVWGREGEGKWHISNWSSTRRMGVLYNVELVSCVQWCKNDSNELLFLFYDLTVSVIWITAIYSESKFVCIIVTFTKKPEAAIRFIVCTQDWFHPFLNC